MDKIFSQRYAFCDFSNISGFPNLVPNISEWEGHIPRFRGEYWEVPTKFLLDFHECMIKLKVIHEYFLIKLFRYSLEGKSRDWCRYLPVASVNSLKGFHFAFHSFCKENFSDDFLYPKCHHVYDLLCKSDNHERNTCVEEYIVIEEIVHDDQEVHNIQNDMLSHEVGVFR